MHGCGMCGRIIKQLYLTHPHTPPSPTHPAVGIYIIYDIYIQYMIYIIYDVYIQYTMYVIYIYHILVKHRWVFHGRGDVWRFSRSIGQALESRTWPLRDKVKVERLLKFVGTVTGMMRVGGWEV